MSDSQFIGQIRSQSGPEAGSVEKRTAKKRFVNNLFYYLSYS